ncbi:MAG: ATP-binding protein [Acidobacteriaceae bacterium]|nr:ATP-binding protein [Acidobacteriaceae bacterium]
MIGYQTHDFATRPILMRRAVEAHQAWIEQRLGVPLVDAVIFEVRVNLVQIGIEKVLGCAGSRVSKSRELHRLRRLVAHAEIPPAFSPFLKFTQVQSRSSRSLRALLTGAREETCAELEWQDCPVALRLHSLTAPIVAMNVYYHSGPYSDCESRVTILIAPKACTFDVIRLMENITQAEKRPQLHTLHGETRHVARCDWNQLVLDEHVISLLKRDFETFWARENWFRERELPFRRGYLLHGLPGNGKSTAVRAMLTSQRLTAYTMRLFDQNLGDTDLDELFETAISNAPAMVLLEDLDRAFPKTGEALSRISLQQLLNSLDGVGSGEGIIVVATANEPTLLDPAILRRPGRFDRVVHFPNPSPELRKEYFRRMNPSFRLQDLETVVNESSGFSFAQLREIYIMAGQTAFERRGDIRADDLLLGVRALRQGILLGTKRSNAAGYSAPVC